MTGGRRRTGRGPIILDGVRLASERAPKLAARASAIHATRGRSPRLALLAFADASGRGAYSARKVRACAAAGVAALPCVVPYGADTSTTLEALDRLLGQGGHDALFVEFPFPETVDEHAIIAAIPLALDIDIMTTSRIRAFMEGEGPPPLTVTSALLLLDRYAIDIRGLRAVIVAVETPFSRMFREALLRRGAGPCALVAPAAHDLDATLAGADLVVSIAAEPGLIASSALAPHSVAIDGGYFNPGARGDIDVAHGIDHLRAFAPVPGAIGPMTISVLIERVIAFAESA